MTRVIAGTYHGDAPSIEKDVETEEREVSETVRSERIDVPFLR